MFVRFLETKSPANINKVFINGLVDLYVINEGPITITEGFGILSNNFELLDVMLKDETDSKRKNALLYLIDITRKYMEQKKKVHA